MAETIDQNSQILSQTMSQAFVTQLIGSQSQFFLSSSANKTLAKTQIDQNIELAGQEMAESVNVKVKSVALSLNESFDQNVNAIDKKVQAVAKKVDQNSRLVEQKVQSVADSADQKLSSVENRIRSASQLSENSIMTHTSNLVNSVNAKVYRAFESVGNMIDSQEREIFLQGDQIQSVDQKVRSVAQSVDQKVQRAVESVGQKMYSQERDIFLQGNQIQSIEKKFDFLLKNLIYRLKNVGIIL